MQTVTGTLSGHMIGVQAKNVPVRTGSRAVEVTQNVGGVAAGRMDVFVTGEVSGTPTLLPIQLAITGQIHVERVTEGQLAGLTVERLAQGIGGLRVSLQFNIERFEKSELVGVEVGRVEALTDSPIPAQTSEEGPFREVQGVQSRPTRIRQAKISHGLLVP